MNQAQKTVKDFIKKYPEHADEAEGFLELYEMEVESGESENNEFSLLENSLEELLKESANFKRHNSQINEY